jgi:hypothetical protein
MPHKNMADLFEEITGGIRVAIIIFSACAILSALARVFHVFGLK